MILRTTIKLFDNRINKTLATPKPEDPSRWTLEWMLRTTWILKNTGVESPETFLGWLHERMTRVNFGISEFKTNWRGVNLLCTQKRNLVFQLEASSKLEHIWHCIVFKVSKPSVRMRWNGHSQYVLKSIDNFSVCLNTVLFKPQSSGSVFILEYPCFRAATYTQVLLAHDAETGCVGWAVMSLSSLFSVLYQDKARWQNARNSQVTTWQVKLTMLSRRYFGFVFNTDQLKPSIENNGIPVSSKERQTYCRTPLNMWLWDSSLDGTPKWCLERRLMVTSILELCKSFLGMDNETLAVSNNDIWCGYVQYADHTLQKLTIPPAPTQPVHRFLVAVSWCRAGHLDVRQLCFCCVAPASILLKIGLVELSFSQDKTRLQLPFHSSLDGEAFY